MKKGKVFILSGPSGVGKKTVRENIDFDALNMENSVSWTTRAPRAEDKEGVTYHFVTEEEFENAVASDAFLEHAGYGVKAYGTPRKPVEDWVSNGVNVMLEIEVKGAAQVMKNVPDAVSIFLVPPTMEELRSRLLGRQSETVEEIERRLEIARSEMPYKDSYKYIVVNDKAEDAAREVEEIIRRETAE